MLEAQTPRGVQTLPDHAQIAFENRRM